MRLSFFSAGSLVGALVLAAAGCGGGGDEAVSDQGLVDFGVVTIRDCPNPSVRTTPVTQTIALRNDSQDLLEIGALFEGSFDQSGAPCGTVPLDPTDPNSQQISDTFTIVPDSFVLLPGQSRDVLVVFEPPSPGVHEAQVRFVGTGGNGVVVEIRGIGTN